MSLFMTRRSLVIASLAFACEAALEPAKLSSFGTICGDPRIFKLFTQDDSVEAARNVKFTEIKALMGEKQKLFQDDIDKETAKIKDYQAEIDKRKSGKPAAMDAEATKALIYATITVDGDQGAKKCGCGFDCGESFEQITATFSEKVLKHFKDSKGGVLSGKIFTDTMEAVFKTDGEMPGDCDFIAEELLPIAMEASAKSFVPGDSSAWVDKKANALKKQKEAQEKLTQCKTAQTSLEEFEAAMKERNTEEKARGDTFRNTKKKFNDASDDLMDVEDEAAQVEEDLKKALEKLKGDDKAVKDATASLEKCQKGEAELMDVLKKVTAKTSEVEKKFRNFKAASDVVEELRDAVSMTTLKMWILFQEAALKPIQDAGLSLNTKVDMYFHKTLAEIPTGAELQSSVNDLVDFCEKEAKPAFKLVEGVDNLESLCPTGNSEKIMGGIRASMTERRKEVMALLEKIKTWFDPLKGQSAITTEEVKKRRTAGEPEGLREIMTTYSRSTFYKGYLENWTLKGKFLRLISQLGKEVEALSKLYGELLLVSKELPKLVAKATKDREEAQKKLEDAMKALKVSEAEKKELEDNLKEQKELMEKMATQVTGLEDKLQKALEAWKEAKKTLTETYVAGIAFIEEEELITGPEALLEEA